VGLPYSYEKRSANAAITLASKISAARPTAGTNARLLTKKKTAAPAAKTAVAIQATVS